MLLKSYANSHTLHGYIYLWTYHTYDCAMNEEYTIYGIINNSRDLSTINSRFSLLMPFVGNTLRYVVLRIILVKTHVYYSAITCISG